MAPVWFIDECRIPPRAELWRIREGHEEQLLAVYVDVATGWGVMEGADIATPKRTVPQSVLGWVAMWDGYEFPADLIGDQIVLAAASAPPEDVTGFRPTMRGCWSKEVPSAEVRDLFEVNAVWNQVPDR